MTRLDNFLVPSAMHREFGAVFPPWIKSEQAQYGAIYTLLFFFPCVQYFRVSVPPAVRPTLSRQMDIGSLTCAQIWARAVHTKGGGGGQTQTNKPVKGLTGRDRKLVPRPV